MLIPPEQLLSLSPEKLQTGALHMTFYTFSLKITLTCRIWTKLANDSKVKHCKIRFSSVHVDSVR